MMVCRYIHRHTRDYHLNFLDHQHLFIYQLHKSQKLFSHFFHWSKLPSFPLNPPASPPEKNLSTVNRRIRWAFSVAHFWFCRQPRQYSTFRGKVFFFFVCFIFRKITLLRDKLSLYLLVSNRKSCKGAKGLCQKTKHRETAFF
jgi:hypothetical protein